MNTYTPEELDQIFVKMKELVMESENKLRIIDLRKFIDEIYPREADTSRQDFADLKQSIVGLNKRVSHIEECLGIDFDLDGNKQEPIAEPPVEYNFIKDDVIRDKITAYYREMLRYQYATRNHKQCFGEFCRLAIIQIELLFNYFFADNIKFELVKEKVNEEINKIAERKWKNEFKKWRKNGGVQPVKQDIIDHIKQMFNNNDKLVSLLSFSKKSELFCNRYQLEKVYIRNNNVTSISIWTSNMRNRKSHGSQNSIEPYENNYLTTEEKNKLDKWEKDILDYVKKYNVENEDTIKYEEKHIIQSEKAWNTMPFDLRELYNSFIHLQWVSEKSFKDVHDYLRIIASTCAKELKQ
jgi:hypothetical protein